MNRGNRLAEDILRDADTAMRYDILPRRIIPRLPKRSGLVGPIGSFVLDCTCAQFAQWKHVARTARTPRTVRRLDDSKTGGAAKPGTVFVRLIKIDCAFVGGFASNPIVTMVLAIAKWRDGSVRRRKRRKRCKNESLLALCGIFAQADRFQKSESANAILNAPLARPTRVRPRIRSRYGRRNAMSKTHRRTER